MMAQKVSNFVNKLWGSVEKISTFSYPEPCSRKALGTRMRLVKKKTSNYVDINVC